MNIKNKNIDKIFFSIFIGLLFLGAIMFTSSSLGVLAKNQSKFYGVIFNQFVFGLIGGLTVMYFTMQIPYKFWRKYSMYFFVASIVLSLLVFIPGLGMEHGGARRWVNIFGLSFQPVEFLKIGFIMYFSAWLSWVKGRVSDWRYSFLPLISFLSLIGVILHFQNDTKSFILLFITGIVMLFVSGVPWKYIISTFVISLVIFAGLIAIKPHLLDRVKTFIDPSRDPSGSSYQLNQALIAIGSGGVTGRGLGQSIQKFNYLPEPQGDSIFAVVGEELGFIGSVFLIFLYVAFALRGYKIGYDAPDSFSKLFTIGIITLFTAQSFMNIASIIGVFPLTGVPLVFASHGGTNLLIAVGVIGILLNISRERKKEV
jgi:cell division protein FtsW